VSDLYWRIEETCFNAFPPLRQVLLGDWLLRFANGMSRRANSVNPLGPRCLRIEETIISADNAPAHVLYTWFGLCQVYRYHFGRASPQH
jgi:hypothetical protein